MVYLDDDGFLKYMEPEWIQSDECIDVLEGYSTLRYESYWSSMGGMAE